MYWLWKHLAITAVAQFRSRYLRHRKNKLDEITRTVMLIKSLNDHRYYSIPYLFMSLTCICSCGDNCAISRNPRRGGGGACPQRDYSKVIKETLSYNGQPSDKVCTGLRFWDKLIKTTMLWDNIPLLLSHSRLFQSTYSTISTATYRLETSIICCSVVDLSSN